LLLTSCRPAKPLLDDMELAELDSFVNELGLNYSMLYNVNHRLYLSVTNEFMDNPNSDFVAVVLDGNQDLKDKGQFWTRSMDGCIENMKTGTKLKKKAK
jgi:hypothetical protein